MKIELSRSYRYALATVFAKDIHSTLVELHLRAINKHDGKEDSMGWSLFAEDRRGVRAAISSIADKHERRVFIGAVRYIFHRMRADRGTSPTSRGYVANVLAFRAREKQREAAAQ